MRDHFFKATLTQILASFLIVTALAACSDNTSTVSTTTTPVPTAAAIALGTNTNWILTDNANAATLTATLVDASNAVMQGIPVSFSTTSGNLNASSATTDANGQAIVTLKSGVADFTNRTATVTASVGGLTASIPILIKGSTLVVALSPSNSIQVGAGTLNVTATAAGASGIGKSNQTIRFSIGSTSTGSGTLSATTLVTDATGVASPLTFTPTAAGTVVLTAEWLDSATGVVTVTTTQDIIVTAASGLAFAITTPAADPTPLSSGATQGLVVTVPATIAGTAVADVRISATSGTWVGASPATGPLTSILQTPSGGAVTATYTAPSNSGSVTVQVDALDGTGVALSSLTRTFVISAPFSAAYRILLSASASTIVPSSGGNISTSTLEAIVLDANNNSVGGAAVMFGLLATTGSGESVSPAVAITDSHGKATTTFSAGSAPTLASIHAQASIVGEICTFVPDPLSVETNLLCDSTPLKVSSSAVSVTVGFGTTVEDTANATQYKLPGSVLVVNSNGSAVAGATVTLSAYPVAYRDGIIYADQALSSTGSTFVWQCVGPDTFKGSGVETSFMAAEDINRNGIMETGEDVNANGLLSPPQAAGGTVPLTVTTDSNGAATFFLQYPKSSAWFIGDEVTARVIVMGTESTAKMTLMLPMSVTDKFDPVCAIGRTASY